MFGKKNKKPNGAAPENNVKKSEKELKKETESKIADYEESIKACKESIETELKALKIAASNLKVSSKSVSRVKGIFTEKVRKKKKYADRISAYEESLEEYIRISSHINWLINTVSSCYEADARLNEELKKYRQARKIRINARKYVAKVNYKKSKLEKCADGIVMPVTNYVR